MSDYSSFERRIIKAYYKSRYASGPMVGISLVSVFPGSYKLRDAIDELLDPWTGAWNYWRQSLGISSELK